MAATVASASATSVSTTSSSAKATATTTTSSLTRLGFVHLDLLTIESDPVHLTNGSISRLLVVKGHKSISFSGVVNISHLSKLLEFRLQLNVLVVLINSVDEQLASVPHGSVLRCLTQIFTKGRKCKLSL